MALKDLFVITKTDKTTGKTQVVAQTTDAGKVPELVEGYFDKGKSYGKKDACNYYGPTNAVETCTKEQMAEAYKYINGI